MRRTVFYGWVVEAVTAIIAGFPALGIRSARPTAPAAAAHAAAG